MTDAAALLDLCRDKGLRLASAESCTGGMIGAALTDIAGSSDVFERGVITYSNAAKVALLGVSEATLQDHGAVSEAVAREMAEGLLARAPVDIAVSVTGIAGPGGSERKPEGRVCFGLATTAGSRTETVDFGALGRARVRAAATAHALALLAAAARDA
ncbi:CinA family protein [Maritimibacter sp. HL-12]|jgi:nicotinamide-nucleotide amidase|uniref:CinA family protein n=1 Tax=Maritimibacter sp. HL-12 TaxID=1162418 RepID=UPI000A0EF6F8|nr:CinA family protein [Maritimibacter sp. HL-12]SMH55184.1 nicotinamide-nucleotide amidase [Maritimibacter sp. HL-12]